MRRHPAIITAGRLEADVARHYDQLTQEERDDAFNVVLALREIAQGDRDG